MRIDRLKFFLDSMGGGAWPFLVGGVICLLNCVNERDLDLLNSLINIYIDFKDRKSTRLNSSHSAKSRMPSSA